MTAVSAASNRPTVKAALVVPELPSVTATLACTEATGAGRSACRATDSPSATRRRPATTAPYSTLPLGTVFFVQPSPSSER